MAITLRSRQLLKMGTWLPETCSANCKGEIKDNTKVTSSWFLIHTELRCTVNHTLDLQKVWLLNGELKHSVVETWFFRSKITIIVRLSESTENFSILTADVQGGKRGNK